MHSSYLTSAGMAENKRAKNPMSIPSNRSSLVRLKSDSAAYIARANTVNKNVSTATRVDRLYFSFIVLLVSGWLV